LIPLKHDFLSIPYAMKWILVFFFCISVCVCVSLFVSSSIFVNVVVFGFVLWLDSSYYNDISISRAKKHGE